MHANAVSPLSLTLDLACLAMSPTSLLPLHWICLSVTMEELGNVCYCLTMILTSKVSIRLSSRLVLRKAKVRCRLHTTIVNLARTTYQLFSSRWTWYSF